GGFRTGMWRCDRGIKLIGFEFPHLQDVREDGPKRVSARISLFQAGGIHISQAQEDRLLLSRTDLQPVPSGGFGSELGWIDRPFMAVNDIVVDPILDVPGSIRDAKKAFLIGFILCKQERDRALRV